MKTKQTTGLSFLWGMCLVLLLFFGCNKSAIDVLRQKDDEQKSDELEIAPVDSSVPMANTEFGFNLFNAIWETEQNQNIFISPFSVSVALSMTVKRCRR